MTSPDSTPVVVARTATEPEAQLLVAALAERGIEATAEGSFTSSFRAEAPGDVAIVVRQDEAERARQALEELRRESQQIDWSQVDVGSPK